MRNFVWYISKRKINILFCSKNREINYTKQDSLFKVTLNKYIVAKEFRKSYFSQLCNQLQWFLQSSILEAGLQLY